MYRLEYVLQNYKQQPKLNNYYTPETPCSNDECVIGGNIATNAGGVKAVKYGVTADQVLELALVTAEGNIVVLGGHKNKNSTSIISCYALCAVLRIW